MITGKDIYDVLAAIVPLYVAMILAYGSVRWWKIFTPEQCAGINRFVAVFAVPLLGFHFISSNDPYAMNYRFLAADSLQKVVILSALFLWQAFSGRITLEWVITLFSLSTLPNTLVMGIPLLRAMYGDFSASLMVQIVVLQSVIWYTLMLFLFEFRGARALISEQFPDTAASITSFKVDSDVISLNGREPLETEAEVGCDGKLRVVVRRSTSSVSMVSSSYNHNKSHGFNSMTSITPRASNLTGVEIYSLQSSREPTPRASSFNQNDFYAMFSSKVPSPRNAGDVYSLQSSKGPTPRTSNFDDEGMRYGKHHKAWRRSMSNEFANGGGGGGGGGSATTATGYPTPNPILATTGSLGVKKDGGVAAGGGPSKELHMFVWSSSASPVSEGNVRHPVNGSAGSNDFSAIDNASKILHHDMGIPRSKPSGGSKGGANIGELEIEEGHIGSPDHKKVPSSTSKESDHVGGKNGDGNIGGGSHQMPPASVMTRLILIMVWRKLIRNPNTYSSLIGVVWSLICYRWNIQMPKIVKGSISILSDAGLGMAMFSLGLFMALQPKIIACGRSVAAFSMAVRFLTGPAVIAATSTAIGVRGVLLHVAIVQAALPQGIVPFVFAKEYNCHPDILSTAVIFGMLIALPITILYYILLGL